MALYSKEKNFIFVHPYKCAGNSIRQMIGQGSGDVREIHGVHIWIKDVKRHFYINNEKDFYDNAFKFAFVRHPYAWLVSTYFYIRRAKNHLEHGKVEKMSADQFVNWVINYGMKKPIFYGKNGYYKLLDWVIDSNDIVQTDFVGKVENFESDMGIVLKKLNIESEMLYNNTTNCYDKNTDYLSDKTKSLINKVFANDFSHFGYDMHDKDIALINENKSDSYNLIKNDDEKIESKSKSKSKRKKKSMKSKKVKNEVWLSVIKNDENDKSDDSI